MILKYLHAFLWATWVEAANTIPSNGAIVSFLTGNTTEMDGVLLYNPNDQLNVSVTLRLIS